MVPSWKFKSNASVWIRDLFYSYYYFFAEMGFRSWRRLRTRIGKVGSLKSSLTRCETVRGIFHSLILVIYCESKCGLNVNQCS